MPIVESSIFDRIAAQGFDVAQWASILSVGGGLGEIFVSQDARLHINGQHALPQLIEAYKRSKILSNVLLLTGTVGGALAYQQTKDKYWLIGAALLAAGIPYDLFVEAPVIEQLKFFTLEPQNERPKKLLASWTPIQLGKLGLAASGAILFYWFARR